MRGSSRRDQQKEQFWRKALARFGRSGLSPGTFCKQEGLNPDLLRYWKETIARRDTESQDVEAVHVKVADATFVPVVVSSDRRPGTQQMPVAEIIFAGGSVFLFNGITADTVRALWLALRSGVN